ncbi:MAG: YegP family protein [Maribacter sp.]|nr:YegP family protein [Maribacter sp.]
MLQVIKENDNSFRFSLQTEDGGTLLTSLPFSNKLELEATVRNLHALKKSQNIFERKTNHEGRFLFCLKDAQGKQIGSSELYYSEAGMENGIKNLKKEISRLTDIVGL